MSALGTRTVQSDYKLNSDFEVCSHCRGFITYMHDLVPCQKCAQALSATAIICPACGHRGSATTGEAIGVAVGSAIGLVLAPAEFLTAFLLPGKKRMDPQEFARERRAIDCFALGEVTTVFVTETDFLVFYPIPEMPEISHFRIDRQLPVNVELTIKRSLLGKKNVVLRILEEGEQERTSYIFKGKDAELRAKWAKKKFEEYSAL